MGDCGGCFGILACCFKPLLGVRRIVIDVNQIVQGTRMVGIVGVNFLEELCRLD
jgi:hypothetical protein